MTTIEKNMLMFMTYLPSSSLRSYSSVKRVDVTIELDIGVLFVTAAILIIEVVVVGGDTFILLSCLVLSLFLLLLLVL